MVINAQFNKQSGVVLITALIMIFAVSGIAVSLMSSSTIDLKIVGSNNEKEVASNLVNGDSQRTIGDEKLAGVNSKFYKLEGQFEAQTDNKYDLTRAGSQVKVYLFNENNGPSLLKCLPRIAVTPSLKCNYLRMETSLKYGKVDSYGEGKHSIELHSGVVQALGTSGKSL